ncbi:putative isomerase [Aquimarina sp. EL_43]|uniref:MGH1-like glycoside hydrolase domain-containing protein n=1 Tax=unclassified Aquimarina TaxID=2627091 RepID=UPI0018CBA9FE|nr:MULTISPECIES: trehalase family glycosidase [unclassified Aquimarina]MBG6133715.1 putative isomerase [Aquimarina sp. EL_35]MBG6153888.1 putative isomerase [Aquimarina sp. EL_32]MBG6172088.1 putative isomerase [Aquimarina sp. EL_43]
MNKNALFILISVLISCFGCKKQTKATPAVVTPKKYLSYSKNILNYSVTPKDSIDKSGLMFSDQGAWFAYSFPDSISPSPGFSGPFLMTQQNGIWSSKMLVKLNIEGISWSAYKTTAYNSHLEQILTNNDLILKQKLVFASGHSALIQYTLTNKTDRTIDLTYNWKNQQLLTKTLRLESTENKITIRSSKSNAMGYIVFPDETKITNTDSSYVTNNQQLQLKPKTSKEIVVSQTFIFPEYSWEEEQKTITTIDFDTTLRKRSIEKETQLTSLIDARKEKYQEDKYAKLMAKAHLTLQNNWRIAAGEIQHEGLFPSYHYKWFNGFWSWDSWKHAVGLSYYNTELAKKQMRLMFEFQNEDGFVADCVYRDTSIEDHNYRDTKPPLSAWAVVKIYEKDHDLDFVKELYPKLKKYHYWWYQKRDHDKDGLCEYGSTDGSLVAAKWESGMDNAIRFDDSKILKNEEGAYSLDQESVDLNAYLYAEKLYLEKLAEAIQKNDDVKQYLAEAKKLKETIQNQFYDPADGWFYDTNLDGTTFIKGEGSEGWTPLWANVATQKQAEAVKNKMMNPNKFYTKMPFQTMSADHPKFDPLKGYWRGPNWLDQSYFGVKGLRNYGFDKEADQATAQIIEGAEGLLEKGKAIRENYHPLTGQGLHAQNFSWSAAHIIMLLIKE